MNTLKNAVELIKVNKKTEARQILVNILEQDEDNEGAWLWMTKTDIPDQQKIKCLKRVLEINPDNDKAEALLRKLEGKQEEELLLDEFSDTPEVTPSKKKSNAQNWLITAMLVGVASTVVCVILVLFNSTSTTPTQSSPARVYAESYVDVLSMNCRNDGVGNTILEGRVTNTSETLTLQSVRLRGTLLSRFDESVMGTDWSYIDSDILPPNSTSSYTVYVDNPDEFPITCSVSVESASFN